MWTVFAWLILGLMCFGFMALALGGMSLSHLKEFFPFVGVLCLLPALMVAAIGCQPPPPNWPPRNRW